MNVVVILVFGAFGGILRYAVDTTLYGSIAINLLGVLVLGVLTQWITATNWGHWVHTGIAAGFLGSLTSFAGPMIDISRVGTPHVLLGDVSVVLSVMAAPMVCFLGQMFGRRVFRGNRSNVQAQENQEQSRKNTSILGYILQSDPQNEPGKSQT